jgi:hypothetical protein
MLPARVVTVSDSRGKQVRYEMKERGRGMAWTTDKSVEHGRIDLPGTGRQIGELESYGSSPKCCLAAGYCLLPTCGLGECHGQGEAGAT